MAYPLSGDLDLAAAYKNGRCRDCGSQIQPLGPSSRCEPCDQKKQEYRESGWGLEELIRRKTNDKEILDLCFVCGDTLKHNGDELTCPHCAWNKKMHRAGHKVNGIQSDSNPYKSVWDTNDDTSVYLTPSFDVMAERSLSTARYYERMAERGGPRGREYKIEAQKYFRDAEKMKQKAAELRRQR